MTADLLEKLETLRALKVAEITGRKVFRPEPHQTAPPGDWYLWLLMGGRGTGKTDSSAYYFDRYMCRNPGHRGAIIAPTIGDAVTSCVKGRSGLLRHNPSVQFRQGAGGMSVTWPNGSEAKLFGAHTKDDPIRLRAGGNTHIAWCEELAAWRYLNETWDQLQFGLREGKRPHVVASTTPKPRPLLKELRDAPTTVVTVGTIFDNPHLEDHVKQALLKRYEGTRQGEQELMGKLIEEMEGALWTFATLEACRVDKHPDLARVVVAVDPSGGDEDGNDEQGIVVAGRGVDGHGYVLADRSCKLTPDGWGRRAVQAYLDFEADKIVCEGNFGGDMVVANVMMAAQHMGVTVNVGKITASRGKVPRAEPIAGLYERRSVHHVGVLEKLEYQMTQWEQASGWSPDRMDAAVWALTELMQRAQAPQTASYRTGMTEPEVRRGDLVLRGERYVDKP